MHVVCHGHRLLAWPALQAAGESIPVSGCHNVYAPEKGVRVGKGKSYNCVRAAIAREILAGNF